MLAAGNPRSMQDLFQEIKIENSLPAEGLEIRGIKIDSREINPGDLFIAITGTQIDGHRYLEDAVNRGAGLLVGSESAAEYQELGAPYIQVPDTRLALASLAAAWFDYPARKLIILGVTGTDGKTTTANLIYQVMLASGIKAGLISTVNAIIGDKILDTGFHVTTPEALDVQFYLSEMVKAGLSHVVLEATSHGLAQKRVAACEFDIGVVTNITHEHLDYHGSYQAYLTAKAELLHLVSGSREKPGIYQKVVVLNKDDQSYPLLTGVADDLKIPEISYGLDPSASVSAEAIRTTAEGIQFSLTAPGVVLPIQTSLIGDYNVSNCLAAAAACLVGLNIEPQLIHLGIANLQGIPGRMEAIDLGQDFIAMVDFAHTPNALKRTLAAARDFTDKRVIAVFGSAGLRDKEKRRLMAEVSGELADLTVLTAEDPRTESLDGILEEMAAGILTRGGVEGENFWRERDRGRAIRLALDLAQSGDVVLVCGKGHEQSMCFGLVEYPWDDRTALKGALADFLRVEGPEIPYLPTRED